MCGWSAWAQNVTEQQALATAQQFLQGKTFETTSSARRAAKAADIADTVAKRGYYVFNVENNGGYVIVSADERTERPVLAYSTCGHFDYDALPPNAKAWMDGYTEGIRRLKNLPADYRPKRLAGTAKDEGKKVGPLLTTEWWQREPYNKNLHMYVAWNDPEDVQTGIIAKGEFIKTWTLHVPKGTKEKYEKDRGWQDFGTIVEDNTTAIQHLATGTATGNRYCTLDGRELSGNPTARGIYIVCPDDGGRQGSNARKVIVK